MRIGIVGPGRLGRSLEVLWSRAGHDVRLTGRDQPPWEDGDAWVLTVPDRALTPLAATLQGTRRPVLHCSGVSPLDVLAPLPRRGSFHPLMTFPGPEVALPDLDGVPAAVDGIDDGVVALATGLAEDLGMAPVRVAGDRRLYHGAAVMAGNFGTVLLAIAGRVLAEAGVEPAQARGMLAPLAIASIRNAVDDPAEALTGPLARGDHDVLDGHRAALDAHGLQDLVRWFDAMRAQGEHLVAERSE
jgi:predicted short-subunit dehydrogenase-like oxidoreductase (DUF2520 family)